ncbi:MAG: hypothetical protein ACTSXU_11940, partial [Promethearchaeota archaeon]
MNLKTISRILINNWWVFYGIFLILMFFSGIALGIIFTLIGIVIFIAIFILKRRTSVKISKNLLGIDRITERDLAKISNVFIEDVHAFLHDVSRNPETSGIAIL